MATQLAGALAGWAAEVAVVVERVAARSPSAVIRFWGRTVAATIRGRRLPLGGDIMLEVVGLTPSAIWRPTREIQAQVSRLRPGEEVRLRRLRGARVVELTGRRP